MKRLSTFIAGAAIASLVGPTAASGHMRSLDLLRGGLAEAAPHAVELEPFRLELILDTSEEPRVGDAGGSVRGGAKSQSAAKRPPDDAGDRYELASIASDHLRTRFRDNVYGTCVGVELDVAPHVGGDEADGRVVAYEISGRAVFADEATPPPESLSNQVTDSFASRDGAADFVRRLGSSGREGLARVRDVAAPLALLYPDGDPDGTAGGGRRLGVSEIDWKEVAERRRCGRHARLT